MKQTCILLAAVLAGVTSLSAIASTQGRVPTAHADRAAEVQLRDTGIGKILVNASGFTLYRFTKDPRNRDTCVKISGCSRVWPVLSSRAKPTAGSGLKASVLSTLALPGGVKQVTYAGHPLYLYAPATEPAEISYVGAVSFGGTWDAVNAAGNTVK
jgi:predicted lipoprotein with Yx(FWY)xxD motif